MAKKEQSDNRVYLIDGSAYIYRAYHAIAPLTNSKGLATNATLGFINMVNRLLKEKKPSYLAIAFDAPGPVFRHELYPEYKANRPPMPKDLREQIPYIKEFVLAANILLLEESGIEADDIIATAVSRFREQGLGVVIVSGDKDLLQLVDDQVVMYDPMREKQMGKDEVRDKYGVPVSGLLDYFALVGDSADNVPGVAGVGPKTAQKLLDQFGSLEALYQGLLSLKKSKMRDKIANNKDLAFLSRRLIALKNDCEIPVDKKAYQIADGDEERLAKLYTELEFRSLLKGVDSARKIDSDCFILINSKEGLTELAKELDQARLLVLDTETTSLEARHAELVGISLCTSLEKAYYLPCGHLDLDGERIKDQFLAEEILDFLKPYLNSSRLLKLAHNWKYDYTVLGRYQAAPAPPLADTMIAAYLCEAGGRSLKLDDLCRERGLKLTAFAEVVEDPGKESCFAYVDIKTACRYSCEDVYGSLVLWQEFAKELEEMGLGDLFSRVEMPVLPILALMESYGICVDPAVLHKLDREFSERLQGIEKQIYQLADEDFNINSPKQLGSILFEKLGLPHGRKTKTGYSTDVKVLEKLAKEHQLPALVLEYRSLAKLLSTYVEKLEQLIDPQTGRIHSSFNQSVTATGRLSSSNPNLQNIPIRTEEGAKIRNAFVPGKDHVFVAADYSQIDLRVLAHYSEDSALVKAFTSGGDIHARTAAEIFGVSEMLVNGEMRRVAKSINFGIVYGMSAFGLASQLDIPRKDAQRFIDRYFNLYGGVKIFMEEIVELARENGYVTTLLGRRRTVSDIHAKNRVQRQFAERMAINTPIQGTAADIIKLAMIECQKRIDEDKLAVKMLLQIHDELVFEMPPAEVARAVPLLRKAMEEVMELKVPLVVNCIESTSLAKE